MEFKFQDQFLLMGQKIFDFLPSLLAGVLLIAAGWFLGWLAKRVIIQLLVVFRLERMLVRFRWGEDFLKADVRYGFYNVVGDIAFVIVFLILFDSALNIWKLEVLSNLLERAIFVIPRLIVAVVILGVGWLIASAVAGITQRTLRRERILRASLIARFVKALLLVFFAAMALTELDFAREIVVIGFATIFISLGVLAIVLVVMGGKDFLKKVEESFEEE